ncbi:serine protease 27-like [Atheta coriaria]|uniref:serine protease 27-like n=1 Tax=Dalotia coriaria TaxID=877792 RepID=UPI0031F40579
MATIQTVILLCCAVFASAGTISNHINTKHALNLNKTNERIISGSEAVQGQYKWHVGIKFTHVGQYDFASGALISPHWVLTRAYVTSNIQLSTIQVILGATHRTEEQVGKLTMTVKRAVTHPLYTGNVRYNVGLLELSSPVQYNDYIGSIRLPDATNFLQSAKHVWVSGWGQTDPDGEESEVLNFVQLTTITNEKCKEIRPLYVTDEVVCASGLNGEGICGWYDVGAALVQYIDGKWTHVGVVNNANCTMGTSIRTASILDFIYDTTGPL